MRPLLSPARLLIAVIVALVNLGFYLPKVPEVPGAGGGIPIDKLVHVSVFALTIWAFGRLLAPERRFPIGWVVLGALAHALVIELVQLLLPRRSGDPLDVLADVLGIALGLLLWQVERVRAADSADREPLEV